MLRLSARYQGKAWSFELPPGTATLGSGEGKDLVLPVPGISRRHVRLERDERGVQLTDLGSKNGIRRDGKRFEQLVLRPGESVRLGRAQLELENVSTAEAEVALRIEAPRRAPRRERRSSTSEGATTSEVSPTVALELVRRIEARGLRSGDPATVPMLEEARRLLEATWLAILEPATGDAERRSEAALLDHAGSLPESGELTELAVRSAATRSDSVVELEGRCYLVATAPERPWLAARRTNPGEPPRAWQLDFFDFLAERLGTRPADATPHVPAASRAEAGALKLPPGFIRGTSPAMAHLFDYLRSTVRSRLDVVILGETGTGKELLARIVHDSGPTADGPFVAINCAAIPAELLEAELFGVEARVATGVDPRPGLFVRAHGGTLFLDEIGDMPEPMQAKLLRALQEREVLAVGGSRPRPIAVRVISASNKNLREMVIAGRFRADLFYRLRGLQFHLPPLRERIEDLPALVAAFVAGACACYGKRVRGLNRRALELLLRHDWPGNVRELRNEVERAVLVAEDHATLEPRHFATIEWQVEHREAPASTLDLNGSRPPDRGARSEDGSHLTLARRVDALEHQAIVEALAASRNNKSGAARLLGITRNGLALKMKRLGIG